MIKAMQFPVMVFLLFLVGCETLDTTTSIAKFSVEIVSDPSGADIEINNNYVGKTPITVNLEGWESTRTFTRSHTIVAHPIRAGGQTQVKIFLGWREPSKTYGDVIPDKIYFDMNLIRIPNQLDLNINK